MSYDIATVTPICCGRLGTSPGYGALSVPIIGFSSHSAADNASWGQASKIIVGPCGREALSSDPGQTKLSDKLSSGWCEVFS